MQTMKIWIGRRESDILTCKNMSFNYSITYYGSNDKIHNYAYCTLERTTAEYDINFYIFVNESIRFLTKEQSDFEIYFYNNKVGRKLEHINPSLKKHFRNCNSYELLDWLNNKSYTRFWLSNSVNVPPYALLSASECNYKSLKQKFPDYFEYIIQSNYSSGGTGTYHLTPNNENNILNALSQTKPYLVSPYIDKSISACCHVIIGKENNLIFPIGFQIISDKTDKMYYVGTSFKQLLLEKDIYSNIYKFIDRISKRLARNGYRGICGYDFLIKDDNILLIEINPRFMASSYLLNHVLEQNKLPSLFDFNNMAFNNDAILIKYQEDVLHLSIPLETYTKYYHTENDLILPNNCLMYFDDGLQKAKYYKENAYLYRYIIN